MGLGGQGSEWRIEQWMEQVGQGVQGGERSSQWGRDENSGWGRGDRAVGGAGPVLTPPSSHRVFALGLDGAQVLTRENPGS